MTENNNNISLSRSIHGNSSSLERFSNSTSYCALLSVFRQRAYDLYCVCKSNIPDWINIRLTIPHPSFTLYLDPSLLNQWYYVNGITLFLCCYFVFYGTTSNIPRIVNDCTHYPINPLTHLPPKFMQSSYINYPRTEEDFIFLFDPFFISALINYYILTIACIFNVCIEYKKGVQLTPLILYHFSFFLLCAKCVLNFNFYIPVFTFFILYNTFWKWRRTAFRRNIYFTKAFRDDITDTELIDLTSDSTILPAKKPAFDYEELKKLFESDPDIYSPRLIEEFKSQAGLGTFMGFDPESAAYIDVIENMGFLFYDISTHDGNLYHIMISVYRFLSKSTDIRTSKNLLHYIVRNLVGETPVDIFAEYEDYDTDNLPFFEGQAGLRKVLDNWTLLENSDLAKKFSIALSGIIACGLAAKIGLPPTILGYRTFVEKAQHEMNIFDASKLVKSVSEVLLSFCEIGYDCFKSKNLDPLLYQNRKVREWIESYDKVLEDFFSIPLIHNVDPSKMLQKFDTVLMLGKPLMAEHGKALSGMYRDLLEKRTQYQRTSNVPSIRQPPFSVLITGRPEIGKTSVAQIIAGLYHKVVVDNDIYPDLEWDPKKNSWTYNSADDFFSGYKGATSWFILMDDIGKSNWKRMQSSSKCDVEDIITIVNSVCSATPQAALEDKGVIPFIPKLFVGTTNTREMNAAAVMTTVSAVTRRFPIVVEPILRKKYINPETNGLYNPDKEDCFDMWDFKIWRVRTLTSIAGVSSYEDVPFLNKDKLNMHDGAALCKILSREILIHERKSRQMMDGCVRLAKQGLCEHGVLKNFKCTDCEDTKIEFQPDNDHFKKQVGFYSPFTTNLAFSIYAQCPRIMQQWIFSHIWSSFFALVFNDYFNYQFRRQVIAHAREQEIQIYTPYIKSLRNIAIALVGGVAVAGFMCMINKKKEPVPTTTPQGNIWVKSENPPFHPPITVKKGNLQELGNSISKSMIKLYVPKDDDSTLSSTVAAFCIKPGMFVTVSHIFRMSKKTSWLCKVELPEASTYLIRPISSVLLNMESLVFIENDLVVMFSNNFIPRMPLYHFLPENDDIIGRNIIAYEFDRGFTDKGYTIGYNTYSYPIDDQSEIKGRFYLAERGRVTVSGDCGTLYIAETPDGCFITGLHTAGQFLGGQGIPRVLYASLARSNFPHIQPAMETLAPGDMVRVIQGSGKSGKLGKAHPTKGVHNWVNGSGLVLGSYPGRTTNTSRVCETEICDSVHSKFGISKNFTQPLMKAECRDGEWFNPFIIATADQAHQASLFHEDTVIDCVDAFFLDLNNIPNKYNLGSVSLEVAVNGIMGDQWINSLPFNTSGGFFFPGSKKQYFHMMGTDSRIVYIPNKEVIDAMNSILICYRSGQTASVLFNGTLKDEPVKLSKRAEGKTRVFTACDVAFSIIVRQQYLQVVKLLMTNNFFSEMAVGMNCYTQWQSLYSYLTEFGENRMIAGDYKAFDKNMPAIFIRAAFSILDKLRSDDLSEDDRRISIGIATDIMYPITNMNGDVIQFLGGNSSGHPLTVIINSLVNSLYMRYVWKDLGFDLSAFRNNVKLMTLGDDNIMSSKVDEFNHTSIVDVLFKYGVTYTMADKESASRPFIHISECDFLKRSFTFLNDKVVAPLAETSILKSLCFYVYKGNVSEYEIVAASYLSARREWSLHGEEVFTKNVAKMEEIFDLFPAYKSFFISKHSLPFDLTLSWVIDEENYEAQSKWCKLPESSKRGWAHTVPLTSVTLEHQFLNSFTLDKNSRRTPTRRIDSCARLRKSYNIYTWKLAIAADREMHLCNHFPFSLVCDACDCISNIIFRSQKTRSDVATIFRPQSSPPTLTVMGVDSHMTLQDHMSHNLPPLTQETYDDTVDLKTFLSRPVKIAEFDMTPGSHQSHVLFPWTLWVDNAIVKRKLEQFYLINGQMQISFYINASPFHSGLLLASYSYLNATNETVAVGTTGDRQICTRSQRPHVWINVGPEKSACLCVPFFHPLTFMPLVGPDRDFNSIGRLNIDSVALLAQLSLGDDPITLTVFAHLIDATLSVPLNRMQASEYVNTGVVSGPASAVASIAGRLISAPFIGKFALATEIGANALAGIARLFGFSRPVNIDDIARMRPTPMSDLALTEGKDNCFKLTTTAKQELSVDPTTLGLPSIDELSIDFIAKRETFFKTQTWSPATVPGFFLTAIPVSPMLENFTGAVTGGTRITTTALSFASRPFKHWSGSLRYRFQIVCSQMHRGRLAFVYDPIGPVVADDDFYTSNNVTIIDIAESRDFTIEIPWQQPQGYAEIVEGLTTTSAGAAAIVANARTTNGVLYVVVLNRLTCPDGSTTAQIVMSISAGDDFELANPSSTLTNHKSIFVPQSSTFEITPAEENASEQEGEIIRISNPISVVDSKPLVYFGEKIVSFRSLLKRYNRYKALIVPEAGDATQKLIWQLSAFPLYYGFDPNGLDSTGPDDFNYCCTTMINYLGPAYAGWKGSLRWKFSGYSHSEYLFAQRNTDFTLSGLTSIPLTAGISQSLSSKQFVNDSDSAASGAAFTPVNNNNSLEIEIPYHTPFRFSKIAVSAHGGANSYGLRYPFGNTFRLESMTPRNELWGNIQCFVAAGEDFAFYGWIGSPTIYTYTSQP